MSTFKQSSNEENHHYENLPMKYTEIFLTVKIEKFSRKFVIFFLFLLKKLTEVVLMSTHHLCFGAKIRKIGIPLHTTVLLYKSGVYRGYT